MQNLTRGLLGIGAEGLLIDVECRLSNNLPTIVIVGSANKTVSEAKDRLRGAFASSKLQLPRKRITLNLAPASILKDDPGLDLAMALSILQANGNIGTLSADHAAIGELGLDGSIRPVRGIIGKLLSGRKLGVRSYYIPRANLKQAQMVPGLHLFPIDSLGQLYMHLSNIAPTVAVNTGSGVFIERPLDTRLPGPFEGIAGQEQAKRALVIAAAGGHNILLTGPPGTGKSMLAKTLCSLLPSPTHEEILEITHIASLSGQHFSRLIGNRPFRQPHHTTSHRAIIGGGTTKRPGEISLAHHGVLFLDELPEFSRQTLEALRQPLEDRVVHITRTKDSLTLPADFILAATANPCPCGFSGSTTNPCVCSRSALNRYSNRLSGPIVDRLDIVCTMRPVQHTQLLTAVPENNDQNILSSIHKARELQLQRFGPGVLNSSLTNTALRLHANLTSAAQRFANDAGQKLSLSARSYIRMIKVSRTIADLDNSPTIDKHHIGEALAYRRRSA